MTPERKAKIKTSFKIKHLTEALSGLDEAVSASIYIDPFPQEEIDKIKEVRDIYRKRLELLSIESNESL